jgi:hypothetical protein
VLGVLAIALTFFIGYRAAMSNERLISIGMVAMFAGLLFESLRVADNWRDVVLVLVISYCLSLAAFLPGKREHVYNFESHVTFWQYAFVALFAFSFAVNHKDKVTAKLNEGITLLLSLSVVYWIVDYGFVNLDSGWKIILMVIVLLFTGFSILSALTNLHLSRTTRLILSIWSAIIMLTFAIDNIYKVFSNNDIDSSVYLSDGIYTGLQFFLLGVSAIYIAQNYALVAGFFPQKNGNYRSDLQENKENHLERFSEEQIHFGHAIICIVYALTIYGLNYAYQVIPRHTMIWLMFLTFHVVLKLVGR